MPLKESVSAIYAKRWALFSAAGLIMPIALIQIFMQSPVYRATAVILIERPYSSSAPHADGDGFYKTQCEIIKSGPLADRVMDALKKTSPNEFKNATMGKMRVSPISKTRFTRVSVDYKDPLAAAKMVNALLDLYISDYAQGMPAIPSDLQEQKLAIETELNDLGRRYKKKHPKILALKTRLDLIDDSLEALKMGPSGKSQPDNIVLITRAEPPKKPIVPVAGILYSLLFSAALGIGMIFLLEFLNSSLKSR